MFMSLTIQMYLTDKINAFQFHIQHPICYAIYAFLCLLRVNRYLHVSLFSMKSIKAILNACNNMKPFFYNLVFMLGCVLLIFGQIGIHIFGGKINSTTPKEYAAVSGGGDGNWYQRATFNDFPSALIMLWSLIINNCWPNLTIQAVAHDDNPWEIIYFVAFILITIVIIFNIVIGFILDVVMTYLTEALEEGDVEENYFQEGLEGLEELEALDEALKKIK